MALNFQAAFEAPTRSEHFGARRRGREGEEDDGERPPPEEMHGYRLIDLRARSFLRGDYQTTWGWAKVFLKALVE